MPKFKDASDKYRIKRWMRPNAHRFIRPDWRRYVRPGYERDFQAMFFEFKFDPDQPRVPAGNRDGGQWTNGSANADRSAELDTFAAATPPALEAECDARFRNDVRLCNM